MQRLEARAHQSRAARARPDRRARGARARGVRPGRERGVRGRRSSGRARLRERSRAGSARCGSCWSRRRASTRVLDDDGQRDHRVRHERAGDLIAVAEPDAWFTYYYWLDDAAGAGLRAHGRHPPQAGLRPGGAVPGPGDPDPGARSRVEAGASERPDSGRCSTSRRSTPRSSGARTAASASWSDDGPCVISRQTPLFRSDR